MKRKIKVNEEDLPKSNPVKIDKIDETVLDIIAEVKDYKSENIFIIVQDCLKKIRREKIDNGREIKS